MAKGRLKEGRCRLTIVLLRLENNGDAFCFPGITAMVLADIIADTIIADLQK